MLPLFDFDCEYDFQALNDSARLADIDLLALLDQEAATDLLALVSRLNRLTDRDLIHDANRDFDQDIERLLDCEAI